MDTRERMSYRWKEEATEEQIKLLTSMHADFEADGYHLVIQAKAPIWLPPDVSLGRMSPKNSPSGYNHMRNATQEEIDGLYTSEEISEYQSQNYRLVIIENLATWYPVIDPEITKTA